MSGHAAGRDRLSLDEKLELLDGADLWHTAAIARAGVPAIMLSDGPHGLRVQFDEADHLGVEGSEPAVCFPPAVAVASTWNRDVARAVGAALGDAARAAGVAVLLGPGINLKRSPLCGRNFEYYSEDPLLTGELAGALIDGVQSRGVGTAIKHFAANNQETERMSISVEADARTLRELYLAGFERAIRSARPWAVMCSYNRINGVFASEDPWLLTRVLRDEWGFDGLVVSDWGAVYRRDRALAAGLDLEMPSSSGAGAATLRRALDAGEIGLDAVDRGVERVLRLVDRVTDAASVDREPPIGVEAQRRVAHDAALEGAVLLKNERSALPIDPDQGGPVAVIGEFARTPRYQGAGSSQVASIRVDSALDALRGLVGRELRFAPGYGIGATGPDDALVAEAVEAATGADVAVLFLGLPPDDESESFDRSHLRLPDAQLALLERIAGLAARTVVVLSNGGVVEVEPWQRHADAVLEGWLLGEAGGGALAELLVGVHSPSGRLAETIPIALADNPTVGNFPGELGTVRYGERLLVGYRWYDAHRMPVAYPFGHGLGYTDFAYEDLAVHVVPGEDAVVVAVTVRNTGERVGSEVVQVYVSDPDAAVARPDQELTGFAKLELAPGEARRVRIELDERAFAYWHPSVDRWVVEGGAFEVRVGRSSRDIRLASTVSLEGERVSPPLTLDSPAGDWWQHPVLGPRVRELVTGRYARLLADPAEAPLFRPIPLARMIRFPGFSLSEDDARALLAELG
ncbi:glycoside hydrolase family 3 C-terminal domain-containing protein [Galbitalea sp. SE-J8]|uniref:glycoside hydrolase family 3 C-terminal domain-containing protein n=1 Tax=Galbitalea sp. SE-J8 TaxID=3054952 RepID=UPI00259CCA28|nr:glycoside hydrolase family 3 C-terminal domain-containing protein [Galbitalea sp. SE-J8]MDM4762047.1 glycoside hydrolase family 3 C-terminal domain-containing protein [Galbitalea sp. SE-J8]